MTVPLNCLERPRTVIWVPGGNQRWSGSPDVVMTGPSCIRTAARDPPNIRSEEHTSELQSLMRISYAVFCLKKKKPTKKRNHSHKMQSNLTKLHHVQKCSMPINTSTICIM